MYIFEDRTNQGFKFDYEFRNFQYIKALRVKMEVPFPCCFVRFQEINSNIISLVYLKSVQKEFAQKKIFINTFNVLSFQKKLIEKDLSHKKRKHFLSFGNPEILLDVSKGVFRILMVTNPEKDEFNKGTQDIEFLSEAVKLLDFY